MGTREEGGAGEEERGRAGGNLSTQGQEEKSGAGAGGCGETTLHMARVHTHKRPVLTEVWAHDGYIWSPGQQAQANLKPSP